MLTTSLLLTALFSPSAQAECSAVINGVCADLQQVVAATERPAAPSNPLIVSRGQITFDVEGNDNPNSPYFSRHTHWPAGASGVTIGRGYDMRHRSRSEVESALLTAGVPAATAKALAKGAGLSGRRAQRFASTHRRHTITREAQKALFESVYAEYELMTRDLVCGWTGRSGDACATFWSGLDPAIQTMLVDLRYRGDLTRNRFNSYLKSSVNSDSVSSLSTIMSNGRIWRSVPADRFRRRKAFMTQAAQARRRDS